MQTLSLNGDWTLYYALETKETENSLDYLRRAGECIPAQVPGNVEIDLERAGKEPDPFFGENIYRFRKYEFYRWQFERDFLAPEKGEGEWKLIFEGLNNFAEVYLNGRFTKRVIWKKKLNIRRFAIKFNLIFFLTR